MQMSINYLVKDIGKKKKPDLICFFLSHAEMIGTDVSLFRKKN
jgi:hypothetical protein